MSVDGAPVISVTQALALLDDGKLDGRDVAVSGYFERWTHSCYGSDAYRAPIQGEPTSCGITAFADSKQVVEKCIKEQTVCNEMTPIALLDRSGPSISSLQQVVVIGHTGDARMWQCTVSAQADCARAFVADRVAWADGQFYPLVTPQLRGYDNSSSAPSAVRMTIADVQSAVGGATLISAAPFRANDVALVDPRWNMTGDDIVWIARYLTDAGDQADPTRAEQVTLVDDATGKVIDSHPLPVDPSFTPARLWTEAQLSDLDAQGNVPDSLAAFFTVRRLGRDRAER